MTMHVNGFQMDFIDEGTNIPPLLLIHAYPLNSSMWDPQVKGLSPMMRITAPDVRGFGGSEPVPGPYTMQMLAEDCKQLLDDLGIKEPVVVGGLSMGGYITFAFYQLFRERVEALILAATRSTADTPEGKVNRDKSIEVALEDGPFAITKVMLPHMFAPVTYQQNHHLVNSVRDMMDSASVEGIVGALSAMRDRPDYTPLLSEIDKPVLILHGEADQIIPVSSAEAMHSAIQGSCLRVLPDSGHLLNLEQPDLFNQAVHEFWRDL